MTLARLSDNLFPSYLDRFFEGNLMNLHSSNFAGRNSTLPAVNVKENDHEYCIDVAAPGMNREDFKVSFDNGSLMISSEKKAEHEEKDGENVTRKEFSYQAFQRSFNVPGNMVNVDKIGAKYEDGILHITLPKREEAKPKPAKKIKIF
jgi:HSP20 family protein